MKKIIIAVLALLLLAGGVTAAKVLAQEFMQVSPRTWVLGSAGAEAVDIHLAVPLLSVDRNEIRVNVYDQDDIEIKTIVTSTGADSRGDLVIKFVPDLTDVEEGDKLTVKVTENEDILIYNGVEAVFVGVEVKENLLFVETVIESVVTFLSSIGKR